MVATCYLLGVSTRRMDKFAQSLGITTLSKSQVSEMAGRELDSHVDIPPVTGSNPVGGQPDVFAACDDADALHGFRAPPWTAGGLRVLSYGAGSESCVSLKRATAPPVHSKYSTTTVCSPSGNATSAE